MNLTRAALNNPVAALVAVLLGILFGLISVERLPVQLTPEVTQPEITIRTNWRAADPQEVEAEIVEPQEDVLRGLPGMTEMLASARRGQGQISIKFDVGTDMERALIEVLNRLNRVAEYPEDADEPFLRTVGGRSRPIAWFIVKATANNPRPIAAYQDHIEEVVQTRFERINGVAQSEVFGGREQEIRLTFDPYKAAALGIELPQVVQLAGGNEDVSAGTANVGKRQYTLRFSGAFKPSEFGEMVLEWRDGRPIYLRDVVDVSVRMVDRTGFVITKGENAIAVNAHRESGVNVLRVMQGLRSAVQELESGPLKRANLSIEQVYDETEYIDRAILLLVSNLLLGIALAVGVLWWFLRKFRATLIVALAIPLCLLVTFVFLDAAGRTINVISLAGLAFATGMVLDAGIVVLENIVRLRESGKSAFQAAFEGAMQVKGALFASTVTTVAIFLPVVFLQDESGQLFADLALAIAVAVCVSLAVALTIVPSAANSWLKTTRLEDPHRHWWTLASGILMRITDTARLRAFWITVLFVGSVAGSWFLIPKADYLPEGNRNLVFAFIIPPPGVNMDIIEQEMGAVIAARMAPYLTGEQQPAVKHYFFVAFPSGVFMGARAVDPKRVEELVPLINKTIAGFPDSIAFARKVSLFGGFGAGRTIDINIQGRDIESILQAALAGFGSIQQIMPEARVRPRPGLLLGEPQLEMIPNERRIAEAGWTRQIMARVSRALGQGLFVGDYFDGERRLDIITRVEAWDTPEELGDIPLATPSAGVLPLRELSHIDRSAGPDQIRRLDRRRTVTLEVTPPSDMPLEIALQRIVDEVVPAITPLLPEDGEIRYGGTADKLQLALANMSGSFSLAIAILFLLMAALFRSFIDSLLVLLALPLATVGGVIALQLVNMVTFQPMDLLTMIGFIILLGLVVNNAILLVYQTRMAEREGMARRIAVENAIKLRLRPILMSTLTSLFGMLPLLLVPGAGTELYRGLAAVIVGGLAISTVFTLILLPSLLRIGESQNSIPQPISA